MDATEAVDIPMGPAEIVEHVDEMLSWLAVASEGERLGRYHAGHFRRAVPVIRVGERIYGELLPNSVIAAESEEDERAAVDELVSEQQSVMAVLPRWLRREKRVSYARLVEHASLDEVPIVMQLALGKAGGDDATDLRLEDQHPSFIGVRYRLVSIGDEDEATRKALVARMRLPQVARVFLVQEVLAFEDGRSNYHRTWFAMWNDRFFDLGRQPLGLPLIETGELFSPELLLLTDAAVDAMVRESDWIVELALSARRTGIGLRTDALGARELVNMLRSGDTPKGRRKSLVHWVSEHMRRRKRLDAAATIKVAAHLRGINGIDAGRYHARIWPATLDIARAKNGVKYDHATQEL